MRHEAIDIACSHAIFKELPDVQRRRCRAPRYALHERRASAPVTLRLCHRAMSADDSGDSARAMPYFDLPSFTV